MDIFSFPSDGDRVPDIITLIERERGKAASDWSLEEWREAAEQIRLYSDECERLIATNSDLLLRLELADGVHREAGQECFDELVRLRSRRVGRPRKKPVIKNHLMLWSQRNQKKPRGRPALWSNERKQCFIRSINEIKESESIKTDKDAIDYFLKPTITSAIKRAKEVEYYRKLLPSLRKSVE